MKKFNYHQLRAAWLDFYKERGHTIIPSASVVPENDGSVLFTNAGMHPLVPFLMGERHPGGKRLANIQKCVRTGDIEEVGDMGHLTFFEMMGNWSLGDYFKKEKCAWSFEFLTSPKYLDIPKELVSVTCFAGDEIAPKDTECAEYWKELGIPSERIFFLDKKHNWWQLPSGTGPCGPDSEMFMDTGKMACGDGCNPGCDCGKYLEIGNDVYMQYIIKSAGGKAEPATQKNVDTGMGLERLLCICNGFSSVYETELFAPAIVAVRDNAKVKDDAAERILVEHTRAAVVIIGDGVVPSNSGAGYVLRRLIRRAARMSNKLGCDESIWEKIFDTYLETIGKYYTNLVTEKQSILKILVQEVCKFEKTLEQGIKEFEKVVSYLQGKILNGKTAFRLYDTYGFPIELTCELALEKGLTVDMVGYEAAKEAHAQKSAAAAVGVFKGGLADTSDATARLHTATHILLAELKRIYGEQVMQKGSNITPERLRFDFNVDHKLDGAEIAEIEKRVNNVIERGIDVKMQEMPIDEARALGATGSFSDKYGDVVKVYSIAGVSCEICGGPHAKNTKDLGKFKIIKEESVSAGVRRIKATVS